MAQVAGGRLGQRAWYVKHMDLLLAEAVYHRAHHDEEAADLWVLWHWGAEEGSLQLVATE